MSAVLQVAASPDAAYILRRVIDAILREDIRACASAAEHFTSRDLPPALSAWRSESDDWLGIRHLDGGTMWIPVMPASFMQDWRSDGGAPLWQSGGQVSGLVTAEDVVERLSRGLEAGAAALFAAFANECRQAGEQRQLAEEERRRWFASIGNADRGAAGAGWHDSLLHYDRVGAFLDHPLYPTARAKLGFDRAALSAYGPEFGRTFQLRWIAVPRALCHASWQADADPLPGWPGFRDVGLDAALAATHALVPVHPFVWGSQLDAFLRDTPWAHQLVPAPLAWMPVTPTLSVRTLALAQAPGWHVKLPLTIRTLGARNIRTIKPSTIGDGHRIQTMLAALAAAEPSIAGRLLLTDESRGAHVEHCNFLGYIARRYPATELEGSTVVAVAAMLAPSPGGRLVVEDLAAQFHGGDLMAFFDNYLDLTLRLHLLLWVRYGIALESNQQNSSVVLDKSGLRLLLKDNDAARIHPGRLSKRSPALAGCLDGLQDQRIFVEDELPLAQMFITITLQLNIAVIVEGIAPRLGVPAATLYGRVRRSIQAVLAGLAEQGEDVGLATCVLLQDERLYLKYLLTAATLADKGETGAADVNKFYGRSAPNFLRQQA